jgi:hypothetical protein
MIKRPLLIMIAALVTSSQAFATWDLDNASSYLSFVSTKAVDIAEVNRFDTLAGRISDKGKAVVTVQLGSVNTSIPVRDERMQELLFETNKYPHATARAKIDMDRIDALQPGDSIRLDTEFTLDLHGNDVAFTANIVVARLSESVLTVTSTKPVILNAASAELTDGIEALRKVANLPSISNAVPVSFVLSFVKSD